MRADFPDLPVDILIEVIFDSAATLKDMSLRVWHGYLWDQLVDRDLLMPPHLAQSYVPGKETTC
jgi:hypothetical protein